MNPTAASRYLWARGWRATVADLAAAFPDSLPSDPHVLVDWASRCLPRPVLPPRPMREPGLSIAAARALLQAAGWQVDGNRIARALQAGEIRKTRDGRLLEGELRCWARRNLTLADGASP